MNMIVTEQWSETYLKLTQWGCDLLLGFALELRKRYTFEFETVFFLYKNNSFIGINWGR